MLLSFSALSLLICFQDINAETVKVTVFYEALCPDCIDFIDHQLFPTYKLIGNDLKVDLVPFGNAEIIHINRKIAFNCQHGPRECYGNEIHSCAIALYSVEESTEFIYCSMASSDPSSNDNLEKCANSTKISWNSLEICYSSGQADQLLKKNGIRTKSFQPPITSVPTVIVDGVDETGPSITDFLSVVCKYLHYKPVHCKNLIENGIEVQLL